MNKSAHVHDWNKTAKSDSAWLSYGYDFPSDVNLRVVPQWNDGVPSLKWHMNTQHAALNQTDQSVYIQLMEDLTLCGLL